jgi:VCBS repeat-containing protein
MRFTRFASSAFLFVIATMWWVGCASNDDPQPVDCTSTDLNVTVSSTTNSGSCQAPDGSVTVTASGGRAPYTFALNNSTSFQSSPTFNGLGAGNYSVTVKDNNGCTSIVENIQITSPDAPVATASAIVGDTDCTTNNGSVTIQTEGTGTFTYSTDGTNFQPTNVIAGLKAGSYTVTVRSASGCTSTLNVNIPNGTGVDYDGEIRPILEAKCQFGGCHPSNGNWLDYTTARNAATSIRNRTSNGSMPPAGSPGGTLSQAQIAAIACWAEHGAPRN